MGLDLSTMADPLIRDLLHCHCCNGKQWLHGYGADGYCFVIEGNFEAWQSPTMADSNRKKYAVVMVVSVGRVVTSV